MAMKQISIKKTDMKIAAPGSSPKAAMLLVVVSSD